MALFATRARAVASAAAIAGLALAGGGVLPAVASSHHATTRSASTTTSSRSKGSSTTTPIQHLVVLFDENVSFDHYFATYPQAANTDGTRFKAARGTPKADTVKAAGLLKKNPNLYAPARLSPDEAVTCDQNHNYGPEQLAENNGRMNLFVQNTSTDTCTGQFGAPGLGMDYYDGNTVTALWNYAQHYAMSDNSWDTTFGPSTPGALNLISGQTHGAISYDPTTGKQTATPDAYGVKSPDAKGVGTVTADPDPVYDDCADADHTSTNALVGMRGKNIGDLLNAKNVTWGWFQGGFRPTTTWDGQTGHYAKCDATTTNVAGASVLDYSPHHNPFAYYASTSNPHHLAPSSVAKIGQTDQANHQYDLTDFDAALAHGSLPSGSFLKAPEAQDGHASYSDPLDEQKFLVKEINAIQKSPYWSSTAIVVAYDDSDGWYDHVAPKITNGSNDAANGDTTLCTSVKTVAGGYADRCGPSQRLPLVVISPYAKANYVDHTTTNQASVLRFVEDNWKTGRIGDASFDATAGSIQSMFAFTGNGAGKAPQVILTDDGAVKSVVAAPHGNGNGNGHGQGGGHGKPSKPGHGKGNGPGRGSPGCPRWF
jgi:phospholipase C